MELFDKVTDKYKNKYKNIIIKIKFPFLRHNML